MSKYKVFYLDDEKDDLVQPIKRKLEQGEVLDVTLEKPTNFEEELDRLSKILSGYDAIILDLQLDGPQENTKGNSALNFHVKYQAPPLAQTIRTLASEAKVPDVPIVLCSTEAKIKASFSRDFTSHDLFDWTFLKDDINEETIGKISSLIEGYRVLNKIKNNFSEALKRDYDELDERILSRFISEDNSPIHEMARVVFKDVVQRTGVLINENTLAARLGIDISKSGEHWNNLLESHFLAAKYKGIFHESWIRWWNDLVIDKFEEITGENLASLDAESRVNLLKKNTEFEGLVASDMIELCKSNYFWNICEISKEPIDPFEGFKILPKEEPKPWQDYHYVSLFAFVTKPDMVSKKGIKIHPSDMERLIEERKKLD